MAHGAVHGRSIDGRDEEALIRANLPLVHYVVAEVAARLPRHVSRADLESAGMAGLAQTARSFEPSRGIPFERYASQRIRGAVLDELRSRDWATRGVRARARTVATVTDKLLAELGRQPTAAEVAAHTGVGVAEVDGLANDIHRAIVLSYHTIVEAGDEHLIPPDAVTPEVEILDREQRAYLIDAVTALPERLRRVVVGYFFEELPMAALAAELQVTESRISQMRAEALELLRDGMNSQLDPDRLVEPPRSTRVANRKAAYYATVAQSSDFRTRMEGHHHARMRMLRLGAAAKSA